MLFSSNVSQQTIDKILDFSGIRFVIFPEKYLGLPFMIGRSKDDSFQSIKNGVWKRIQRWKQKMLSKDGMKFLLKQCTAQTHLHCVLL